MMNRLQTIAESLQAINEGAVGEIGPVDGVKTQEEAIAKIKSDIKNGYLGKSWWEVKYIGNTTEDDLDKQGMKYQDKAAVIGKIGDQYWVSFWQRS